MSYIIFFVSFFCCCAVVLSVPLPVTDDESASRYLKKYGYLGEQTDGFSSSSILDQSSVTQALREFQRFAGIRETGVIDDATLVMMNTPRCGVKDKIRRSFSVRRKRYALQGSKWSNTRLTYTITKYPTKFGDRAKVDKAIAKAFKIWSSVSPLTFEEKKRGRVNIEIGFYRGPHEDGHIFDGPGIILAHAFFPQFGGDVHFDDEENWSIGDPIGKNLLQVAAHEFGHSLGLLHSDDKKAIMYAFYRDYSPTLKLGADDINAIQAVYGYSSVEGDDREVLPEEEPSGVHDTSRAANLCQDAKIDAITRTQSGSTYVFKGDFYWKVLYNRTADGYPRRISEDWNGLEGDLDAALTWPNGKTYFFKGERYWRFVNRARDRGYPKMIENGFEGIPDHIDAAFVWSGNGKTYFFKGDKYYRYDSNAQPPVNDEFPKPISTWKDVPNNIDAAFKFENSRTYFFKGNKYYRYNDVSEQVDPEFPQNTPYWWFSC